MHLFQHYSAGEEHWDENVEETDFPLLCLLFLSASVVFHSRGKS